MRVRLYKRTKDNLSYFQFLTDDEQPILNSQGYAEKDDRNNGVRSVVANAGDANRYERRKSGEGLDFFILKAGNGQEIARSVEFDSAGAMEAAMASCIGEIPSIASEADGDTRAAEAAPAPVATAASDSTYSGGSGDDNYKPLAFYQARIKGVENGFDAFATDEGKFYFTLNQNGKIVLLSETYNSQGGRNNGTESVTKNLPIADRYDRKVHSNGKHYFNLLAGNNQAIATSVWFGSEAEMNAAINALQRGLFGGTAEVVMKEAGRGAEGLAGMEGYRAAIEVAAPPPAPRDVDQGPKKPKVKREKKEPTGEKMILKTGNYLFNDVTYETMKSANGKYYFSFRTAEGKSVMISANVQGYDTEEGVDAAVQRVLEFGPHEGNYEGKTTKNDKFYFYLNDTEGNRVAKSFFYDTTETMQDAVGLLIGRGLVAAEAAPRGIEAAAAETDDYLSCERYAGAAGFHSFFNAEDENWYFAWNDSNGNTILRSEGYQSEKARDNGIESVKKNAPIEERWAKVLDGGQYFWVLKAGNHQEIGRSCPYNSEDELVGVVRSAVGALWVPPPPPPPKVVEAPAPAARIVDDYLPCEAYAGAAGFHNFEHEGEWYFAWNDANGNTILRSEGYKSEGARDNGIESVKKNSPIEARWVKMEADGKYYWSLKAGNNQEIARSCGYDSEDAMLGALRSAVGPLWVPPPPPKVVEAPAPAARIVDDYLPCEAYAGAAGFHNFEHEGEWYFAWNDANGNTILRSEGYKSEGARDNGIESVKKNSPIEARWVKMEADGKYYWSLKAGNNQEIARSCGYDSEDAMLGALRSAVGPLSVPPPPPKVVEAPAPAPRIVDDYLPCEAYAGDDGFHRFMHEGEWYFAYNKNGKTVLRSEGYKSEKARENGIESVKKNSPIEERWVKEKTEDGRHYYSLRAGNKQEIARSCYQEEEAALMGLWGPALFAVAAAPIAAAAVAPRVVAPPPPPPVKRPEPKVVAAPPPPPVKGKFPWWLLALLGLLLLGFLLWRGCGGCEKTPPPPPPPPATTEVPPAPPVDTPPPPPPPAPACACQGSENAIFNIPGDKTPKSLSRLGTSPEFGRSHDMTPAGFLGKLTDAHNASPRDKKFLNDLFKAMGYANGFADAKAEQFSEVSLPKGTVGNMGYGKHHGTVYASLDVLADEDTKAFRIEAANGCHLHFMKTCGNHFFFCPK